MVCINPRSDDIKTLANLVPAERCSMNEAARTLGVNVATLYRWRERGVRGQKLRTVRVGGRTYVTADALKVFLAALNDTPITRGNSTKEAAEIAASPTDAFTSNRRESIEQAVRELQQRGL